MNAMLMLVCVLSFMDVDDKKGAGGSVYVKGYTRKDGTYVAPHYRHAPGSGTSNTASLGSLSRLPDDKNQAKDKVTEKNIVTIYRKLEPEQIPSIGSVFYLAKHLTEVKENASSRHVVSCLPTFLNEVVKSAYAEDAEGIKQLLEKGHAFVAVGPTPVKILDVQKRVNGLVYVEIRVLAGDDKQLNKKGWMVNVMLYEKYDKPITTTRDMNEEEKKNIETKEAEKKLKALAESEAKAADLLKHAKRWLAEGDKENALRRVDELLRRFPDSKVAPEAKKLKGELGK